MNAGAGLLGGGTFGAVGLSLGTAGIQRRVAGACAAGSAISSIAGDGSVACEADDNSGHTLTQVATGTGLEGGPITTSGTLSIATGGVATAMLQDGAVTSAKILDGTVTTADLAFTPGRSPPGAWRRGAASRAATRAAP